MGILLVIDPATGMLLATGLGGLFGLIGGSADAQRSRSAMEAANRTNIQLSREERQWNLDQWHRQNMYNLPSAQMSRLKDAGINPHLAFGQGAIANTAGDVKGYSRPQVEATDKGYSVFRDTLDFATRGAQTAIMNAQIKSLEQKTINEAARTAGIMSDNVTKASKAGVSKQMAESQLQAAMQNVKNLQLKEASTGIDVQIKKQTQAAKIAQEWERLSNLQKEGKIKSETGKMLEFERKLNDMGVSKDDHAIIRFLAKRSLNPWMFFEQLIENIMKPLDK